MYYTVLGERGNEANWLAASLLAKDPVSDPAQPKADSSYLD